MVGGSHGGLDPLAEGLGTLRSAVLVGVAASIVQVASWFFGLWSFYSLLARARVAWRGHGGDDALRGVAAELGRVLPFVALWVIVVTVLSIAFYLLLRRASGTLRVVDRGLGVGSTGAVLGLAGVLLMAPGALLLLYGIYKIVSTGNVVEHVSMLLVASIISLVGSLLALAGDILVGVFLLRLGDVVRGGGYWTIAGALYLAGAVAALLLPSTMKIAGNILVMIALILAYTSTGEASGAPGGGLQ